MKYVHLTLCAIFLSFAGGAVHATTVQNEVSVQASTGGNVSSGQIMEGESKSSVFIETVVDGEVVQHVKEEKSAEPGEAVEMQEKVEYQSGEVEADIQIQTEAKTEEERMFENNQEPSGVQNPNSGSAPYFVVAIVQFFKDIFSLFFT